MYKLSVPVQNISLTKEARDKYLKILKDVKADRVFIICRFLEQLDSLKENVAFFKKNGFEVGIWDGSTIGHGSTIVDGEAPSASPFPPLMNLDGQSLLGTNCPLDKNFQKHIADIVAGLATSGASVVMIDDDFRMSQHGDKLCCACPMHLKRMSEICGEEVTREILKEKAFKGKKNKYRDAWLKAQGDSMLEFARALREEVDKNNPEVALAFCSAHSPWGVDGADVCEITRVLAGKNPPLFRLHGAPYWTVSNDNSYAEVFSIARMFAAFVENEGFDLMAEGDVHPRPRYNTSAASLELFDAAMRADKKHNGMYKYLFDYSGGVDFETGYAERHIRNMPFYERLEQFFENGANCGVRVLVHPHAVSDTDYDISVLSQKSPFPSAGILLGRSSIPTVFSGEGICTAAFGEFASDVTEEHLKNGLILDGVSAVLLTEKGIDVGIDSFDGFIRKVFSHVSTVEKGEIGCIRRGGCRMLNAKVNTSVRPLLFATENGKSTLFAYAYENGNGQRFIVYLCDGAAMNSLGGVFNNYAQQLMLSREIEWLSGKKLPVSCPKHPDLYVMCEKNGDKMSVLLLNCFADKILTPTLKLDKNYTSVECAGCEATLDGDKLVFSSDIDAFGFAAFRLS